MRYACRNTTLKRGHQKQLVFMDCRPSSHKTWHCSFMKLKTLAREKNIVSAGFRIRQLDQVVIKLKYNLTYLYHYQEQLDSNLIKLFRAIKLSYPKA